MSEHISSPLPETGPALNVPGSYQEYSDPLYNPPTFDHSGNVQVTDLNPSSSHTPRSTHDNGHHQHDDNIPSQQNVVDSYGSYSLPLKTAGDNARVAEPVGVGVSSQSNNSASRPNTSNPNSNAYSGYWTWADGSTPLTSGNAAIHNLSFATNTQAEDRQPMQAYNNGQPAHQQSRGRRGQPVSFYNAATSAHQAIPSHGKNAHQTVGGPNPRPENNATKEQKAAPEDFARLLIEAYIREWRGANDRMAWQQVNATRQLLDKEPFTFEEWKKIHPDGTPDDLISFADWRKNTQMGTQGVTLSLMNELNQREDIAYALGDFINRDYPRPSPPTVQSEVEIYKRDIARRTQAIRQFVANAYNSFLVGTGPAFDPDSDRSINDLTTITTAVLDAFSSDDGMQPLGSLAVQQLAQQQAMQPRAIDRTVGQSPIPGTTTVPLLSSTTSGNTSSTRNPAAGKQPQTNAAHANNAPGTGNVIAQQPTEILLTAETWAQIQAARAVMPNAADAAYADSRRIRPELVYTRPESYEQAIQRIQGQLNVPEARAREIFDLVLKMEAMRGEQDRANRPQHP